MTISLERLTGGTDRYEYPTGIATTAGLQHFMIIKELEFVPPNKTSDVFNGIDKFEDIIGSTRNLNLYETKRTFVLFLPPGAFKTQYTADYADVNLGIFGEVMAQNVQQVTDDFNRYYNDFKAGGESSMLARTGDFYMNMGKNLYDTGKSYVTNEMIQKDFAERIKFNVTSAFSGLGARLGGSSAKGEQIAAMSMRAARNPYTALIFTGIKKLREHNFNFQFNPKTSHESRQITNIISNLKHAMLPSLPNTQVKKNSIQYDEIIVDEEEMKTHPNTTHPVQQISQKPIKRTLKISNKVNSAFFRFPSVFTISFYSNGTQNQNLYHIRNSFLMSLKTKFAPTFFDNTGLSTSINLTLSFKENFPLDRSHSESF